MTTQKVKLTNHAISRRKERNIKMENVTIEYITNLPIYGTDSGCTKYLDMKELIVYYIRDNKIVTMISTNPIQMLRYYVIGITSKFITKKCGKLCDSKCKCLNFNNYCRDHSFKNCKHGINCNYIHVN